MLAADGWTSLEITKLVVGALTPILLFGLGLLGARAVRRVEDQQWSNRTIIEKRLRVYEELAPLTNDIFCVLMAVGHFREITPPEVIDRKRKADRIFHVNAPLFSQAFQERYIDFVNVCFEHFTGYGNPPRLRTDLGRQQSERGGQWNDDWGPLFAAPDGVSSLPDVARSYDALMDRFAVEVGVRSPERRARAWLGI